MKKQTLLLMFIILNIFFVSCSQDDRTLSESNQISNYPKKELNGEIPFEINNVEKAFSNIIKYYEEHNPEVAKRFGDYKINVTHVYYKFTPKDSLQYNLLFAEDENLDITTDPFELSIKEKTDDQKDDEIPSFYAIIDINSKVPNVPFEEIAKLHFTDEDKLEDIPSNYDEVEFKQNLMYEARKLANHLEEDELKEGYMNYKEGFEDDKNSEKSNITTLGLFGKKWRPSGTIQVEEDIVNSNFPNRRHYEGVKNVTVNVLKWGWLAIEHGKTNDDGYFSTGTTYTKKVHYKVKFKHNYVTIKEGNFFDTANYFSGGHNRQPLNVIFRNNNEFTRYQFFALIHNATKDYFYRCINQYGLKSPGNLNITAKYNGTGSESGPQWFPFNSAIRISRKKSDGSYRGSDGIYATTVHELTHNGHRKLDPVMFSFFQNTNKTRNLMIESWAEGVETILTNDRYNKIYKDNNYGAYRATTSGTHTLTLGWNGRNQHQSISNMTEYTPMIADLIDNFNQGNVLNNSNLPNERVSGYKLHEIQSALNTSRTIQDWRNRLYNGYNNPTKDFLDDVFNYAQFVRDNNL